MLAYVGSRFHFLLGVLFAPIKFWLLNARRDRSRPHKWLPVWELASLRPSSDQVGEQGSGRGRGTEDPEVGQRTAGIALQGAPAAVGVVGHEQ